MSLFCLYHAKNKQRRMMSYLPVMLLCVTSLAQAGIYKTYDKHGNVVFSDAPSHYLL